MSRPTAIVTGASSGIGLALTLLLLEKGWKVAMADLRPPTAESIPEQYKDSIIFVKTNVGAFEQQAKLFADAFEFGEQRLDLLAANAGMMDSQNLYEDTNTPPTTPIDTTVYRVNTEAAVQGLYLFTHYARRNKIPGGKVIFTSSAVALYGQDSLPMYTSAKLALIGLSTACSQRYKTENITVNTICPAMIATGMAPGTIWDVWPKEHITPMSTAMKAYEMVLADNELTGQVMELSQETVFLRDNRWTYPNASQKWVSEESLPLMKKAMGQ